MAETIVVATDGSETGTRAVDCAAELSNKLGRDLSIVHVLMHGRPPKEWTRLAEAEHLVEHVSSKGTLADQRVPASMEGLLASAENEAETARVVSVIGDQIVARAKRRATEAGARNIKTQICAGDYADEILDLAEAENADMIVIGRRGLGRIREAVLGSVSQKVLHQAPCTVVVVR
jgi:nucleotide-binding universal stress UspA family protein